MSLDRISGIAFVAFGLLLYFVIIPYDTETVDYGWVRPQTLPNAMAWILAIAGTFLSFRPSPYQLKEFRPIMISAVYFSLIAVGLFAISLVGFVYTAPGLSIAIMLLTGEKRFTWLFAGTVVIPVVIWFIVSILLGRLLP